MNAKETRNAIIKRLDEHEFREAHKTDSLSIGYCLGMKHAKEIVLSEFEWLEMEERFEKI